MSIQLFPSILPNKSGYLKVSELHELYWEEVGNPDGVPVVFLHGGPGAGFAPIHRQFFDPTFYRIILFDQRGAGKSRPAAECKENTTDDLVNDLEVLRGFLGVDKWLIFGGSWGSTLALAYGEAHPDRCSGFILRGIFLGTQLEIDWFVNGMGIFFPEIKRKFLGFLSKTEREDPLSAFSSRLNDPDPKKRQEAAEVWSSYEESCSMLMPTNHKLSDSISPSQMLALARIEVHYFIHQNFLKPNVLLDEISVISDKPAFIIQGRYDVVCPIYSADKLANLWPKAQYQIIDAAGHSALEPGIKSALVNATEKMKNLGNF
ncbi:MAG: prolyl aminopeptidase [Rhodospirillaceae bacterium]|nr:prolyl aminopeptidase [Rhodospirillaceae bacterium]|tara:strand:- start:14188 stop:15141 length:954 start_codon:yes stop_codon:yes gene_type:complete